MTLGEDVEFGIGAVGIDAITEGGGGEALFMTLGAG